MQAAELGLKLGLKPLLSAWKSAQADSACPAALRWRFEPEIIGLKAFLVMVRLKAWSTGGRSRPARRWLKTTGYGRWKSF